MGTNTTHTDLKQMLKRDTGKYLNETLEQIPFQITLTLLSEAPAGTGTLLSENLTNPGIQTMTSKFILETIPKQ